MDIQAESGNAVQEDTSLMILHISQVPPNVGLIRVVRDLANPDAEIEMDGSWSLEEIERLTFEYPQLVVELQVTSEEKLGILVAQVTELTKKELSLEKMFDDVDLVKKHLRDRVKDVFDEKVNSFRNKMTEVSHDVTKNLMKDNAQSYENLISYTTECFTLGMLFVEYINELSDEDKNDLGRSLILHKIGYIESMEDSTELQTRTITILESSGYSDFIVNFARDQGTTRFKNGKLKKLVRGTEIGKIVTHYCNCTVNYPGIDTSLQIIEEYEILLKSSGKRREMMFEPDLLTKFVEMIRKGADTAVK